MIETACQFGPSHSLMGVLTTPGTEQPVQPVAVVLFNAGVIPRYGPHRINVKLARALAGMGHPVLRFDLSGVGDSPHRAGAGDFRAQAVRDLREAMDHVSATLGTRRFVLIGICSGAVNAYWAALSDERIAGLMMIDGFWYRSSLSAWMRRWKRLQVTPWAKVFGAAWRSLFSRRQAEAGKTSQAEPGLFDAEAASANPPKDAFSQSMQTLADRGVSVFMLYTGSVLDYVSYAGQLRHAFSGQPWLSSVRCELHEDLDHTMTSLAAQRRFIELIQGWVPGVTSKVVRAT